MTRSLSLFAHYLSPEAFLAFKADIQAAVTKARATEPTSTNPQTGGSWYDGHASPPTNGNF